MSAPSSYLAVPYSNEMSHIHAKPNATSLVVTLCGLNVSLLNKELLNTVCCVDYAASCIYKSIQTGATNRLSFRTSKSLFQIIRKVTHCSLCSVICHVPKTISNVGTLLVNWISEFAEIEITASVAMQGERCSEMVLKSKYF